MSHKFQRIALLRVAKLFDLGAVSFTFLVAFAIASGTFTWPRFAEVLVLRIKIVNFFVFGSYLVFCASVFSLCGFYRSHRMSSWGRVCREILFATILVTALMSVLPLRMEFATRLFFIVFSILTFVVLLLSRLIVRYALGYVR